MQALPSIATLTREIGTISSDIVNSVASSISRSLLIQALDCSSVSMIICGIDDDRTVIYANNAFTQQTGYTKEEIVGKPYSILNYKSDECPDIYSSFDENNDVLINAVGRAKDGSVIPARLRVSPVLDSNGKAYAFIVVKTIPVY